ncbi:signal peptidase II [Peredibacter starrii]|uniref:Lipoprotein signal peptidase n=1 Tax=Peredibacter starrii TaxID=28202 RepID=A0AAX4HJI6_9BACT|nr:signal peptidase II [Peredibacter starrii]WPU63379.1 signal peptidase II [Peredibacter starrii]
MNKRFLISGLILVISIVVDQLTKWWGMTLSTLHFNQGFIMGLYANLPDNIRIVALGCFAGLVFFVYVFLMYIIPSRASILKYGLSLLVGGMFGNVIDKIIYGKTIDFIPFNGTVFNFADVFLWVGVALVLFVIFGKEKLVWHPDSMRGNYLIWPKEQYKVGLNFALVVFSCSLILGIFSFSFFNTSVSPFITNKQHLMLTYFLTYILITLLFCSMAFLAGIVISHKSAGPLYAFELYVDDLIEGKDRKLTFRDGDNYRDLEQVADRLRDYINKHK